MMFKHANIWEASCVDGCAALWVDGAVSKYDLTTAELLLDQLRPAHVAA
jgi:hypothetical protein